MEQLLAEFRAGKLVLKGQTLTPDTRKGLVRLCMTEDTLVHVQWFERMATGRAAAPEDDVIVFPGEAVLEKIPGQRAAVLKFPDDSSRNAFFWLQEAQADGDDRVIAGFNTALNQPPGPHTDAEEGAEGVAPSSAIEHAHVASEAGAGAMVAIGDSMAQLPAAPAQTPGSVATTNAEASHLAAILGNAIAAGLGGGARPAYGHEEQLAQSLLAQLAAQQHPGRRAAGPSLADLLRPEALAPVLRDPAVLAQLAPHLPEEHRSVEQMAALAHSPQFQQQLASFSSALQSGQLDLGQFGLRAAGYSVADFLAAVQELVEREQRQQQQRAAAREGAAGQGGQGGGGGAAPMEQ